MPQTKSWLRDTTAPGELREPGRVLLASCYELGHRPLGVTAPLAVLRRAGYRPATLDLSLEGLDEERIARARFVGISVPMHTALRLGVHLAARVRALQPRAHICFYGLYAGMNEEYLLDGMADSCIGGETEASLRALVDSIDVTGGGAAAGEGVSLPGRRVAPSLARPDPPPPERGSLPRLERYARLEIGGELRPAGAVESSRGCKHRCLHCPITPVYDGRFFPIARATVLAAVRDQVGEGARHITFTDPDFLNGPGHALRIARALAAEHPGLSFDFTARIEHIVRYAAHVEELARLGGIFVVSAVESLSDLVLAHLEKGHTRADVLAALRITRRAGIALRPSLVSFTPWTTIDDYLDVLDFVEREGLIDHVDPVQYAVRLLLPPGSSLLASPAMQPFLGALDPAALTVRWTHPDPRMDQLHARVAEIVEEGSSEDADAARTFGRVREAAARVCGRNGLEWPRLPAARRRPPRLTESWFC